MLFIAAGYFYLNRADPDCGTTFTWATRALGPIPGWLTGWTIIIADLVVMPSLAQITGELRVPAVRLDGPAATSTGRCSSASSSSRDDADLRDRHRAQRADSGAASWPPSSSSSLVFSVVALYKVFHGDIPGSVEPSGAGSTRSRSRACRLCRADCSPRFFIYWGWDTAVAVNEETEDAKRTPGIAALVSTLVLVRRLPDRGDRRAGREGSGLPLRQQRRRDQRDRQPGPRRLLRQVPHHRGAHLGGGVDADDDPAGRARASSPCRSTGPCRGGGGTSTRST